MPQTIEAGTKNGNWWISALGGSTDCEKIREKYTECIGNYALLTRSLNASISNGPWDKKRKAILERAFDVETRNAAEEKKWNEETIKNRNSKLANEIRQYITGPASDNKRTNKWLVSK